MEMKEIKRTDQQFTDVLYALPNRLSEVLLKLPVFIKTSAYEIRLRAGKPLGITADSSFFVWEDGQISTGIPENPLIVTEEELREVLLRITERSVYTRTAELSEGYLSMRNGGRAGVCGYFTEGGCEITSINLRIPRQVFGCAVNLVGRAERGMLIAGPPGSGKTTLLRDLVRLLSYEGKRVCVVDSRGELCGKGDGELDVGPCTDVIRGKDKAQGVEMALRTMYPDFIAFDEVGNGRELQLIEESFYSGVGILTTAHASDMADLFSRRVTRALLEGQVGAIVLLSSTVGGEMRFLDPKEVKRLA